MDVRPSLGGQELASLQHLVAPGVQEPVGRPLPPRLLLPRHGEGPAPGRLGRPGPLLPDLQQPAEQTFI